MDASVPEFVVGGAERLLRVSAATMSADSARFTASAGAWFSDPVVGVCRAALAVVLDDVTGYVVAASSPSNRWPVSLGIRLDFLADPPLTGDPMNATGALVARDSTSAITRGEVAAADGSVLALITQRSHLVVVEAAPTTPRIAAASPGDGVPLRQALGIREPAVGEIELPPSPFAANGMNNVHGGILIAGMEFAAISALGAAGQLRTASIDTAFVRPADAGRSTTFAARVRHRGRSVSVVDVTATGGAGKPCGIATVMVQSATD